MIPLLEMKTFSKNYWGVLHPPLPPPPPPLVSATASITNQNLKLENFWKLIFISIKSWLYAVYILSCVPPSWNLCYIFFLLYFLQFCILMFKTFSLFLVYICCLHSILVLYVANYGINKIYFTSLALYKQPCKCASYFVMTVSNIYVY